MITGCFSCSFCFKGSGRQDVFYPHLPLEKNTFLNTAKTIKLTTIGYRMWDAMFTSHITLILLPVRNTFFVRTNADLRRHTFNASTFSLAEISIFMYVAMIARLTILFTSTIRLMGIRANIRNAKNHLL